ncbi:N-6 DNA methylase [Candidatus Poribacteria bacterium]|nr:N-6 DNA methylase [Candidatus Poribacteria bacterium]MYC40200.1 N-6 DNA methylase [Candidatus Dadabacteria bacterium]
MSNKQIDFLQIGEQKGYIKIFNEGTTIHYVAPDKKYKFTDPEEQVRARYYVELIERYQYPENRIDLEVSVPGRTPYVFADVVVFRDNDKKDPFIVVECKKDETSEAEFSQAVDQAFGNCNALRGEYTAVIAGNTRRFFNVKDFAQGERDQNVIADIPVRYGKIQEWRYKKDDEDWDIQAVGRRDLIRVLDKCHNTLRNSGQLAPAEAFDELSKILFIKLRDEKKPRRAGNPYNFQIKTHETPNSVADRIKVLYQEAKAQDPEVFTREIDIDDRTVFSVVNHLQGINLNATELDVKGLAFERFLGSYFRGDMGQYFTPRELVEFIIKMIEPHHEERILDPACGSGGFLLYAMEHIQRQASEFYDEESHEHRSHWHDFARDKLFGIEVNDAIARVAKMNMILHDDGHSNVIGSDALIGFNKIHDQHRDFEKEEFDIILTNPPFGAVVKKEESDYLDDYELGKRRNSQKTEILFLERCFDFLKWETGKLAIILPDGILNNSSLQYVRDYIEQRFKILAVVSLPRFAFKYYEAGVKPSILLLQKFSETEYSLYQANINRITGENEAVYIPRVEELEDEKSKVIGERGCPAQVAVTDLYQPQFRGILDNIEDLNRKLGKSPTQKFLRLRERFVRDTPLKDSSEFELIHKKSANAQLKTQKKDLDVLEKEYKTEFKAAADSEWESEIKAEYKEKIDTIKEELADKNGEDIREWVQENANHPIFMAVAERIGYDATGRKDSVNDLDMIYEEYRRFISTEVLDFFG